MTVTIRTLYCYAISPIDWWDCTMTAEELLRSEGGVSRYSCALEGVRIGALQDAAMEAFRAIGWEGDFREPARFFALPGDGGMEVGVAIKQDNNGSTFIGSPYPLPWLQGSDTEFTTTEYRRAFSIPWPWSPGTDEQDEQDVEASASEAVRSSMQAGGATRSFRTSSGEIGYVSASWGQP